MPPAPQSSDTRRPGIVERATIVGVGDVGSTTAYAMLQGGVVRDLQLVDLDRRRAEGERMDLDHCVPFSNPCRLTVADVDEVAARDLVIITAGAAQQPGESRLSLVQRNADIFATLFPLLSRNNPDALFVIITNPVDVMTRVALQLSGLPPAQVFGSGTILDTARFRTLLSQELRVSTHNVHAYVIGEHGDSEVLVWSRLAVGPFNIDEYCARAGIAPLTAERRAEIDRSVRRAAYEIIERKGSTHFAIGLASVRIAQSLFQHECALYTLSRRFEGLYGLHDVCLSIPTLLGRGGAVGHLEMPLDDEERRGLLRSAEVLDGVYQQVRL